MPSKDWGIATEQKLNKPLLCLHLANVGLTHLRGRSEQHTMSLGSFPVNGAFD